MVFTNTVFYIIYVYKPYQVKHKRDQVMVKANR